MSKLVLITGGAGFIGSHVAAELLGHGYKVRVLDNLISQVHGPGQRRPAYLSDEAELMVGDVRDPTVLRRALRGVDIVHHLAARVGVGQSMYEVGEYTSVNSHGTAVLLEQIILRPVERIVVASSMSVYGEGLYRTADGKTGVPTERTMAQLKAADWEVRTQDGEKLYPIPTPETKTPSLNSVYALSKYDQEQMCLTVGRAYNIPVVALRLFNAYGPHQALSNPYTGVLAIFGSRLLNNNPPLINEDGLQQRDFVSVYDVARAFRLATETSHDGQTTVNIGGGKVQTILEIARRVAKTLRKESIRPEVTGKYRSGDIRHCFADISRAKEVLGYAPQVTLEAGLADLAKWLRGQQAADRVLESRAELVERGLMV